MNQWNKWNFILTEDEQKAALKSASYFYAIKTIHQSNENNSIKIAHHNFYPLLPPLSTCFSSSNSMIQNILE